MATAMRRTARVWAWGFIVVGFAALPGRADAPAEGARAIKEPPLDWFDWEKLFQQEPKQDRWLSRVYHNHHHKQDKPGFYLVMWEKKPLKPVDAGGGGNKTHILKKETTVANNSWAYVVGDSPRMGTDVTVTQSDGCCLVVQCDTLVNGIHVDRIVLREAMASAYVYNKLTGAQIAVIGSGQYVDINRSGTSGPVATADGVRNIVDDPDPTSALNSLLATVDQDRANNSVP